jgi:hypothetical protein
LSDLLGIPRTLKFEVPSDQSDDSEEEMIFTTSPGATIGVASGKKESRISSFDDDADMGFDLFGDPGTVSYSVSSSKKEKSLAQDDKKYSKAMAYERQSFIPKYEEESDEGEEMGFGLFDNDEPMTCSSTNYQQEKKPSDEAKKYKKMATTFLNSVKSIPKLTEIGKSFWEQNKCYVEYIECSVKNR